MDRRSMNRRNFLRGLGGVTVGLPFLETFMPRKNASAQQAKPIKRFVVFFCCNGVNMDRFFPSTPFGPLTDTSFGTNRTSAPLIPYKDKLLIARGVHLVPRGWGQDMVPGCDHKKGLGHKLTARPLQDTQDNYASGISVDQAIAAVVNPAGRQSMTLKVGPKGSGVLSAISYSGPGTPVVGENNPFLVYRDMMSLSPAAMPSMTTDALALRRKSVLDLVSGEMDTLKRAGLSMADQQKLDLHFTSIRDVEMAMTTTAMVACTLPGATVTELQGLDPNTIDHDEEYKIVGRLQLDVMAIALACGYTRTATIQWGTGAGGPIFRWDGMNHQYNHHKLSHGTTMDNGGGMVNGYQDLLAEIDHWYMSNYAYLLSKLAAYDEGGRSVLDNSAVVCTNDLSDGKAHDWRDIPWIIAGSCGGYFKQGQYLKLTKRADNDLYGWGATLDAPHNRMLISFMNAMGLTENNGPVMHFGADGLPTGEYTQLKAGA